MIKGVLLQFIAGWPGELACHQKAFQPTISDSQGQVSSKIIGWFIVKDGYSNELKRKPTFFMYFL